MPATRGRHRLIPYINFQRFSKDEPTNAQHTLSAQSSTSLVLLPWTHTDLLLFALLILGFPGGQSAGSQQVVREIKGKVLEVVSANTPVSSSLSWFGVVAMGVEVALGE